MTMDRRAFFAGFGSTVIVGPAIAMASTTVALRPTLQQCFYGTMSLADYNHIRRAMKRAALRPIMHEGKPYYVMWLGR